jgi:hypothetical protein
METITVPLRSRRRDRAMLFQKLQHVIPASGLLLVGVQRLQAGAAGLELALAAAEITTSAILILVFVRSLLRARGARAHGAQHAHRVDWVDIALAAVLFAEVWGHYHETHHIKRPLVLLGMVMLILGLFHEPITGGSERRRSLRISDDGLSVGARPFRRFRAAWTDITSITVNAAYAEIRTRSAGTRRIDLRDLEDSDAVRAALDRAREQLPADALQPVPPAAQPVPGP